MRRDSMSSEDADDLIDEAKEALRYRVKKGYSTYNICAEYFGLEPDYIEELI